MVSEKINLFIAQRRGFIVSDMKESTKMVVLLDFSLSVKAATLIFISGCGSAISSAKKGKSSFIYNLVKSEPSKRACIS